MTSAGAVPGRDGAGRSEDRPRAAAAPARPGRPHRGPDQGSARSHLAPHRDELHTIVADNSPTSLEHDLDENKHSGHGRVAAEREPGASTRGAGSAGRTRCRPTGSGSRCSGRRSRRRWWRTTPSRPAQVIAGRPDMCGAATTSARPSTQIRTPPRDPAAPRARTVGHGGKPWSPARSSSSRRCGRPPRASESRTAATSWWWSRRPSL